MGTTTGGLPWPEGTDLVRDGDNSIRALAEAIDPKLAKWQTTQNNWYNGTQEVRSGAWEPTWTFNLPKKANTVLITAIFGLNFVGADSGGALFDMYCKWDGAELFHYVMTPYTSVASGDTYRHYSFSAAAVSAAHTAAGNHTALLGMFSGQGLIMHTKFISYQIHALGN